MTKHKINTRGKQGEREMKRLRIKDVMTWRGKQGCGFTLATNVGMATISTSSRSFHYRLARFFPHIYKTIRKELEKQASWSEDELRDLLVGRYLYGGLKERLDAHGNVTHSVEPW